MRSPRVAIVGSGISGICLAVLMKQAGFQSFTIYEKATEVGGVWRANRYPGLQCDVPSRAYCFTFAPNPDWTKFFACGPEIHAYLRKVADDFGIRQHIRFSTEVCGARWTGVVWEVTDATGRIEEYDFVVAATGLLHVPNVPSIPGMDTFQGEMCHTALWEDIDLKGRRVAVVGTGSSGVQVVCAIADEVSELVHVSRTPQWILPIPQHTNSWLYKAAMRHLPWANRAVYRVLIWGSEKMGIGFLRAGFVRRLLDLGVKLHLRRVKNPALRAALTPDYPVGCKRLVVTTKYYPAIQKPNVTYVAGGIDHIDATGLTTTDGVHHDVDVIILATGFKFSQPMQQVVGDRGQLLEDVLAGSAKSYRSVAVAGFPNFFFVNGPPMALTPITKSAEVLAGYVVRWLNLYREAKVDRMVVREEAQDRFQAKLTAGYADSVYVGGCQSYYLGPDGRPRVLALVYSEFEESLREPVLEDYAAVSS